MSSFIGRKQVRNLNAAPHRSLVMWIQNAYDEVDRLQGVIQELSDELAASRAAQLANFHAAQTSELTSAQAVIYQSRLQITSLVHNNGALYAEKQQLLLENGNLSTENQRLCFQNTIYHSENQRYYQENVNFVGEIGRLRAKNQQLFIENQNLRSVGEIVRLRAKNQQLFIENQNLRSEKEHVHLQSENLRAELSRSKDMQKLKMDIQKKLFMGDFFKQLNNELIALRTVIDEKHKSLIDLCNDEGYMNYLPGAMWNACIRDARAAKTWMKLFFHGSVSDKEKTKFFIQRNPDYIELLADGKILSNEDLVNSRRDDPGNKILASKIRQRMLFCDFLLQLMLHANQKTEAVLEWIMTTTRCLKDNHTSSTGIDYLSKTFMSYSNSSAVTTCDNALQTTYREEMARLQEKVVEMEGQVKRFIPVLFMDNYAVTSYAEESKLITIKDSDGTERIKKIKKFASTSDSLSLMVKMVPRCVNLSTIPDRPGACVDLRELDKWLYEALKTAALSDIFDIGNSMSCLDEGNWLKGEPVHLSELTLMASVPAKSSAHAQIAQVLKMTLNNFLDAGINSESVTPADPEFILQAIVYSLTLYDDMVKNNIFSIPPFHMQKHLLESLERQVLFLRFIKTSFCNAISFKPSIFSSLNQRIDRACDKLNMQSDGPIFLSHQERRGEQIDATVYIGEEDTGVQDVNEETGNEEPPVDVFEPIDEVRDLMPLTDNQIQTMKTGMQENASFDPLSIEKLIKLILSRQTTMKYSEVELKEKAKPKQSRAELNPLPTDLKFFNTSMKEIIQSTVTNHQRLKFNSELLFAVFQHASCVLTEEDWSRNALTRLAKDFFDKQLRLSVEPFNDLNGGGYIQPLYMKLPMFLKMFLVGKKPKICKAGIFLLAQSVWAMRYRPDVMSQLATMGPLLNEVLIEHHNSTIARRLSHMRVDFQAIRDGSVNVGRVRQFNRDLRILFETEDERDQDNANEEDDKFEAEEMGAPGRKRYRKDVRRKGPEQQEQVLRFYEDGKQRELVVLLSENWLQPLIKSMGEQTLSTEQESILESYRPLESEQEANLAIELHKFKAYCDKVLKKEKIAKSTANTNADGSPKAIESGPVLSELEFFLANQTVAKTLKPLFIYMSYVDECEVRLNPTGQKCPSLKSDIVQRSLAAWREWQISRNVCDEDAINKFKSLCKAHSPPLEYNNVNCSVVAREKFSKVKARKCSFNYVYKQGPEKVLSKDLMTTLLWNTNVHFPYSLENDVAQVSDDEDDD